MKKVVVSFFAWVGFFVILVLTLGISLFLIKSSTQKKPLPPSMVLTLHLKDDLHEYEHKLHHLWPSTQGMSLADITHALHEACDDARVKGLLLRLDQATLSLAKIQEIHGAFKRFKQAGKFIVVHVDTFGEGANAMGQYYLASNANEIAMQPYGSLYILGLGFDVLHGKKLLDRLNINTRFYKRDEYKSAFDMLTENEITPANKEALTALGQSLFEQMVRDIALEREMSEKDFKLLVDQAPHHGAKNAMALGLIDHIYYYDQCETYALNKAGAECQSISMVTYSQNLPSRKIIHPHSIALVYGVGPIVRFSDMSVMNGGETTFNAEDFEKTVDAILKAPTIKAVVLRLNSPGGSATASESLWRHVQRLKEHHIPVVVSISDYGASGGYWIASGADAIVAHPGSLMGSIGAISGKYVLENVWEALGITVNSIHFGQQALMGSTNHDYSPTEWMRHKAGVDFIYKAFIHRVAMGRKMDYDHVHALAKGRPWTGEDAYRLGLVDALGDISKAIYLAKIHAHIPPEEKVNIIPYPKTKPFFEHLFTYLGNGFGGVTLQLKELFIAFKTFFKDVRSPSLQAKSHIKVTL